MRASSVPTAAVLLALIASASGAQDLRVSTENDIVASSPTPDDLYTYSVGIAGDVRGYAISLLENAFTDRAAGTRFDETYLSVGRDLPVGGGWNLAGEVGAVHVGHGLFGQRLQNAVHRVFGCDLVDLRYVGSSVQPRVAFDLARLGAAGRRFAWGPRVQADVVPGLRSWLLLGAVATWQPTDALDVRLTAGDRITHASYAPLRPHLAARSLAAKIEVLVAGRVLVSWSYDDYGDRREHVTAGYRLPFGRAPRRTPME